MKSMLFVFFMDKFSLGVFNIVFSLIFLTRGISSSTLAFLMSAFSFMVLILEIPTGIFSDMVGRKKTYVISRIFHMSALFIFCFTSMPIISTGFILYGISQALESGTMKALYFETYLIKYGNEFMAEASKKVSLVQTIGLILGVFIGGILSNYKMVHLSTYSLNIGIAMLTTLISIFIVLYKVNEKISNTKEKIKIKEHICTSITIFIHARKMKIILIGTIFMGLLLFSIETYWQPRMQTITPAKTLYVYLMIVSFINYFAATIGSFIGSYLLRNKRKIDDKALSIYYAFYSVIILSMLLLALTTKPIFFIIAVFFIYITLGIMTICEDTILNINIPDSFRSTLMGVQSLFMQVGIIIGTQIAGFILLKQSISFFWLIITCILFCSFLIILIIGRKVNE